MPDITHAPSASQQSAERLKNVLEELSKRVRDNESGELSTVVVESLGAFKKFFTSFGDPSFEPRELMTGDTARSEDYNNNLQGIFNDIERFHKEIKNLASSQMAAYNYSQIVTKEITSRADGLASTVLDLNILNKFTRADVIVAGDDFRTLENVDEEHGKSSSQAEQLIGGSSKFI